VKYLTTSLVVVIITAVIGLGWGLSEIYSRMSSSQAVVETALQGYQRLGRDIATTLDLVSNRDEILGHWNRQSTFTISIQDLENFPIPAELTMDFEGGEPLVLESSEDLSINYYMAASDQVMSLHLAGGLSGTDLSIQNIALTFLFYAGIILVIAVWIYPLTIRLNLLHRSTKTFGSGDLSARIGPSKIPYIADIEQEFNRMADRIQSLISDNKLLSRAVSHNLKTPLARLRLGVDALEESRDEEQKQVYFRRLNRDLAHMESLIETLLEYARLDEANVKIDRKRIDLKHVAEGLASSFEEGEVTVSVVNHGSPVFIIGDENYLRMQLENLLDNALKYAQSNLLIATRASGSKVVFEVHDDGEGIPLSDREQAIMPFWRGGNNKDREGHGIGLAIVARIAEWFDAKVVIGDSTELGGACIGVIFPVADAGSRMNTKRK